MIRRYDRPPTFAVAGSVAVIGAFSPPSARSAICPPVASSPHPRPDAPAQAGESRKRPGDREDTNMIDTLTIVGRVATDPTQTQTGGGVPVTNFRLATTHRRFDAATQTWTDSGTNWYSVAAFRHLGENAKASLRTGDSVIVTGRLRSATGRAMGSTAPVSTSRQTRSAMICGGEPRRIARSRVRRRVLPTRRPNHRIRVSPRMTSMRWARGAIHPRSHSPGRHRT
jgi:hypothetical protein